jgi:hypothetical protein
VREERMGGEEESVRENASKRRANHSKFLVCIYVYVDYYYSFTLLGDILRDALRFLPVHTWHD